MKKLYLLRHAQAQQNINNDRARTISTQGGLEIEQVASQFKAKKMLPDVTFCSTSVRTIQTLDRLQMYSHVKLKVEYTDQLYGVSLEELVNFLRAIDVHIKNVMVVGHNPTMNELSSYLISERKEVIFGTANLLAMTLHIDNWGDIGMGCAIMDWLIIPK